MVGIGARFTVVALLVSVSVVLVVACSGAAVSSLPGSPPASQGASPTATEPSAEAVSSPEDAVARVTVERPDLAGIGPFDPDRIGGCCWYRVTSADGGYDVEVRVGWGDCPAGCIDEHTWTYRVGADGLAELLAEGGDPIPPGGVPQG